MSQRSKMTKISCLNVIDSVNDFISINSKAVDDVFPKLFDAE